MQPKSTSLEKYSAVPHAEEDYKQYQEVGKADQEYREQNEERERLLQSLRESIAAAKSNIRQKNQFQAKIEERIILDTEAALATVESGDATTVDISKLREMTRKLAQDQQTAAAENRREREVFQEAEEGKRLVNAYKQIRTGETAIDASVTGQTEQQKPWNEDLANEDWDKAFNYLSSEVGNKLIAEVRAQTKIAEDRDRQAGNIPDSYTFSDEERRLNEQRIFRKLLTEQFQTKPEQFFEDPQLGRALSFLENDPAIKDGVLHLPERVGVLNQEVIPVNEDLRLTHTRQAEMVYVGGQGRELVRNPQELQRTGNQKAYLIDITEVAKRMAWTKAEEVLKQKFDGSGFIRRAFKALSENYWRIKFYQEALAEIQSDNNLMKAIQDRLTGNEKPRGYVSSNDKYFQILDSVVDRFEADLQENPELGEVVRGNDQVSAQAADMFRRHALGKWDDIASQYPHLNATEQAALAARYASLSERERVELYVKDLIAPKLGGNNWGNPTPDKQGWLAKLTNKQTANKGALYSSNFWELAEGYKQNRERVSNELGAEYPDREQAIESHLAGLENLDVQLGFKQRDLANNRPKGILNTFEQMHDMFENSKWMSKVVSNPFVWGIASAVTSRAAIATVRYGAKAAGITAVGAAGFASGGTAFIPLLLGAGVGGLVAGIKRSKAVNYDVAQEHRQETLGGEGSSILDKSNGRYITQEYQGAFNMIQQLRDRPDLWNDPRAQAGIAKLFAMRERERTPGNTYDLFRLSKQDGEDYGTTEVAKTDLDLALQEMRNAGVVTPQFEQLIAQQRADIDKSITDAEGNITSFRRKESVKAGAFAGITAIVGGTLVQQGIYSGGRQLEKFFGVNYFKTHGTALEKMIDAGKDAYNYVRNLSLKDAIGDKSPVMAALYQEVSTPSTSPNAESAMQAMEAAKSSFTAEIKNTASVQYPWQKLGILTRDDWHDEAGRGGVRNLLFEGKQQQEDIILDKQSDKVSVSMDRMMNSLDKNLRGDGPDGVNWDRSRDSKLAEIIEQMRQHKQQGNLNEHMKVRIFPENGKEGYVAGSVNEHNQLEMKPEERRLFFDANGKQLARYIEVGYEDDKGNFHTFATSVGKGVEVPAGGPETIIDTGPNAIQDGPQSLSAEAAVGADPTAQRVYDAAYPTTPFGRKVWRRKQNGDRSQGDGGDGTPTGPDNPPELGGRIPNPAEPVPARSERPTPEPAPGERVGRYDKNRDLNPLGFYMQSNQELKRAIAKLSPAEQKKFNDNAEYIAIEKGTAKKMLNPANLANLVGIALGIPDDMRQKGLRVLVTDSVRRAKAKATDIVIDYRAGVDKINAAIQTALRRNPDAAELDPQNPLNLAEESDPAEVTATEAAPDKLIPLPKWVEAGNKGRWDLITNQEKGLIKRAVESGALRGMRLQSKNNEVFNGQEMGEYLLQVLRSPDEKTMRDLYRVLKIQRKNTNVDYAIKAIDKLTGEIATLSQRSGEIRAEIFGTKKRTTPKPKTPEVTPEPDTVEGEKYPLPDWLTEEQRADWDELQKNIDALDADGMLNTFPSRQASIKSIRKALAEGNGKSIDQISRYLHTVRETVTDSRKLDAVDSLMMKLSVGLRKSQGVNYPKPNTKTKNN